MSTEIEKFKELEGGLCAQVLTWKIASREDRTAAEDALSLVRGLKKEADRIFDPLIKATNAAHDEAIKLKRTQASDPIASADRHLTTILKADDAEQERLKAEAERKAKEEAARKDQLMLAEEYEKQGDHEMVQVILESLPGLARAAADELLTKRERIRLEAEQLELAEQAEAAGATEEAEAIVSAPVEVKAVPVLPPPAPVQAPAPVAPSAAPSSVSSRDNWKAEVVDLAALVRAVATGEAALRFVQASSSNLNDWARQIREEKVIHGVKIYNDPIYATNARGGR